jgi:cobalamin synthase
MDGLYAGGLFTAIVALLLKIIALLNLSDEYKIFEYSLTAYSLLFCIDLQTVLTYNCTCHSTEN